MRHRSLLRKLPKFTKKKLCKKKRGKKVSRSAERDSGLRPENPRAFEKQVAGEAIYTPTVSSAT